MLKSTNTTTMAPSKPRLVDTLPSVRTRPMKVIVLGLNRTGTMCTSLSSSTPLTLPLLPSFFTLCFSYTYMFLKSPSTENPIVAMYTALRQLGYHPCHGTNMWEDPPTYLTLWTEAMKAKYMGEGQTWGRRELDVVLGQFDVRTEPPYLRPHPFPSPTHSQFQKKTPFPIHSSITKA